jgi:hypothetical protein
LTRFLHVLRQFLNAVQSLKNIWLCGFFNAEYLEWPEPAFVSGRMEPDFDYEAAAAGSFRAVEFSQKLRRLLREDPTREPTIPMTHVPDIEDSLTLDLHAIPSPDVLFQELDGEMVLLDLASERYFGLDQVGSRIWQLMAERPQLLKVHEQMLREFQVEPETLSRDLLALVAKLRDAGLVSLRAAGP